MIVPVPLVPIIAAIAMGGTIVPHAAGGIIVTSVTGGYLAGTYLTTTAIFSILTASGATIGVGAAALTGVLSTIFGGAGIFGTTIGTTGIFGTTIGATGITGVLMSTGVISSTPIAVPIVAVCAASLTISYVGYVIFNLKRKLKSEENGGEVNFTGTEAKIIEAIARRFSQNNTGT